MIRVRMYILKNKRFCQQALNSELRYTVFFNHVQIWSLGRAELKEGIGALSVYFSLDGFKKS